MNRASGICVAVIALAPFAVRAIPPLAEANAYVKSIYRAVPRADFDYRQVRYAPELARLIWRDDACSIRQGGICAIEAVPFCECQDTADDYAILRSVVAQRSAGQASVTVTLRNGGLQNFTVDLDGRSGVWRVADVHGSRTESLVAFLRRHVSD